MTRKTILPFGDPVLRKVAKPVQKITPKIIKLLDDMAETLSVGENRAALAAPQVGILRRVIVINFGDSFIELINPEILELKGEQIGPEACLSFPGYAGIVKRAQYAKVKFLNRKGEEVTLEGEGFLARCFQHEIDHLNGILFVDHVRNHELYHEQNNQRISVLDVIRLTNQKV